MKAVILVGGGGAHISEESHLKPKPRIEIGGKPIIWHIMKIYSHYGINDFVVCLGYMGYIIKEYFANYFLHMSDVAFDMAENRMHIHQRHAEPWRVTLVDTGEAAGTGGRLKHVRDYLGDETFCFTYGDGVSNVNIPESIAFHRQHGKLATVTKLQPPGRVRRRRAACRGLEFCSRQQQRGQGAGHRQPARRIVAHACALGCRAGSPAP